jgi:hypothetical protein
MRNIFESKRDGIVGLRENCIMRKIFGSKRDGIIGVSRKLHNEKNIWIEEGWNCRGFEKTT